ncbi:MAG TPA: SIS domain-containing protein [Candidatus Acidoferrales bacterium]|nr:SIS domain-containing protein [Candidatus Acidoferrales bacterium]
MKINGHRANPTEYVRTYRQRSLGVFERIAEEQVAALIEILEAVRRDKKHVFTCGNGGSAATASHFASGLGKDGSWGRDHKFRVISLTDNIAWITSLANDTDYSQVFVEQLKNFAQAEDVLVAFSASGNSPNVVRAVEWANEHGMRTVGITGRPGGQLGAISTQPIFVESEHMGHIEEAHFLIQHLVSYYFVESD